jgi:hypothetical protein
MVAVAVGLAACTAGDGPPECANPIPGRAEIGFGDLDTGYHAAAEGSDAQVVLGPQGLHMVVVSIRVQGFEAPPAGEASHVTVAIEHGGQVVGGAIGDLSSTPGADDASDFLGVRTVFNVADVRALEGEMVELVATVTDGCARPIEATRTVRLYF